MCQEMQRLTCRATSYNSTHTQFIEGVHDLSIKIDAIIISEEARRINEGLIGAFSGAGSCGYDVASCGFNPLVQQSILDPNLSQTKGRKKDARGKEVASSSGRIKSGIEMTT